MPSSIGRPQAAASPAVPAEVAATTTGGCGRVSGRGTTGTGPKEKNSPAAPTRSRVRAASSKSSPSANPDSYRASPVPNTSSSRHGPPRPTPSRNRPADT
jgi:hypothetical protein